MAKMLDNLRWHSLWTTHIGCIKGCTDYLELGTSLPWIFGGTGHAFVMNIHPELCPSGPTAWKAKMLFELAPNLGYRTDGVLAFSDDHFKGCTEWKDGAKAAWEFTRRKLDDNAPVYAWELKIPEYYCVHGYDDTGYYYNGCLAVDGEGPVSWEKMDKMETGVIEFVSVHPGEPASAAKAVKEAFGKAIWFAGNPEEGLHPGYFSGLKAYDAWIKFLDGSIEYHEGHVMGIGYNGEVWAECRRYAVDFLNEAKFKVGQHPELFDEAIKHYIDVRENLNCAVNLFPFHNRQLSSLQNPETRAAAVKYLTRARDAEEKGLASLQKIANALD